MRSQAGPVARVGIEVLLRRLGGHERSKPPATDGRCEGREPPPEGKPKHAAVSGAWPERRERWRERRGCSRAGVRYVRVGSGAKIHNLLAFAPHYRQFAKCRVTQGSVALRTGHCSGGQWKRRRRGRASEAFPPRLIRAVGRGCSMFVFVGVVEERNGRKIERK